MELTNKNDFTRDFALTVINQLDEKQKPLWGIMTAQHMIEHLSLTVGASTGKVKIKVFTPEDKIEYYKKVALFTDTSWKEGTQSPALGGELAKLYYPTFEDAKQKLLSFVNDYFDLYETNPSLSFPNPVFGMLDLEEWRQFHFKHFRHHFTQFGIL